MTQSGSHRLRLKLPNGAELEAEGSPEFVAGERREFIALQTGGAAPGPAGVPGLNLPPLPVWEEVAEIRDSDLQLRAKLGGDRGVREACLVLLAAAAALLRTPKPTAAQLARWLRASGYPVARVDRAIQDALSKGDILASGSRRARRYELSAPGRLKAFLLASQLHSLISPQAPPRA